MTKLTEIRLRDYRCFHNEQTAILKPLTLLIGENSTGKTSFMAMVRALYDASFYHMIPDFKEQPYDLGSFDEIAHKRGSKGGKANEFSAGFDAIIEEHEDEEARSNHYRFDMSFIKQGTTPVPKIQNHYYEKASVEEQFDAGKVDKLIGRTSNGAWEKLVPYRIVHSVGTRQQFPPLFFYLETPHIEGMSKSEYSDYKPLPGNPNIEEEDYIQIQRLGLAILNQHTQRPNASAPVRSKPQRTYNPSSFTPDPEGHYVPMYLADLHTQDKEGWKKLKSALEEYGKTAGLFDQILLKQFGKASEPFQVRVRKFDRKARGPYHNLIDVGYGVSQVLPIITELWHKSREGSSLFLLQQPEVHLHPKAQAALGTLFVSLANLGDQLIVETHSDHLVDRVRMEVRDGNSLSHEDVSILFFERIGLDVIIHSLEFDKAGNVIGAPSNYRDFFLEETKRSVGLS